MATQTIELVSSPAAALPLPLRTIKDYRSVWPISRDAEAIVASDARPCQAQARETCCATFKARDEKFLVSSDVMRDVIIGLADGLTVPFALTAGLATLGNSKLVVIAGMAELVSGAISMGVGGFLASKAERDHATYLYKKVHERVQQSCAGQMEREVHDILGDLGVDRKMSTAIADRLLTLENERSVANENKIRTTTGLRRRLARFPSRDSKEEKQDEDSGRLTTFLLKVGEGVEKIPRRRLYISAGVIGLSYFIGGIIPMIPYFVVSDAHTALYWSILTTGIILLIFGVAKAFLTGQRMGPAFYAWSAVSTLAVGASAAAASYGIVNALESGSSTCA